MTLFLDILSVAFNVFNFLLTLLPDSIVSSALESVDMSAIDEYLPYVNYFVPFSRFCTIFEIWLLCVVGYWFFRRLYSTLVKRSSA